LRVLVTGGAGYVGSACLRHLLAAGHDAIAYDNLAAGHRGAVPDGRLVVGDLAETERLADALRAHASEAVIHLAALASVPESTADPERAWRENGAGTLSLLAALRRARVSRLLFSGTCAVYGASARPPLREDAPLDPASPYGRSKLAAEWMIGDFARAHDLAYAVLRYFNAAGASPDGEHGEDHAPETHLVPLALAVALGRRPRLLVYGDDYPTPDGTCVRDYVHVDDLAAAHTLALESLRPGVREVYNVGTGRGFSVLEVVQACERASGRSIAREIAPRRPGDPPALVADAARIQSALGWEPVYRDPEQIAATAFAWHRRHPDGYGERAPRAAGAARPADRSRRACPSS
jgi:UDP-glucose 4-epimerase